MVSKRLISAAAVAAFLLVALAGSADARQSRATTPAKSFVMVGYLGPVDKPFPTVDLSGGVNIFQARHALLLKLGAGVRPPPSALTPFTISAGKMTKVLNTVTALSNSQKGSPVKIGIYSIDMSSGKVKVRTLNATAGKAALNKLAGVLPTAPAAAIRKFRKMTLGS